MNSVDTGRRKTVLTDSFEITTPKQWWAAFTLAWPQLKETIFKCLPIHSDVIRILGMKVPIGDFQEAVYQRVEQLAEERDWMPIRTLLQHCWDQAPDSPHIHGWPAWGVLCDLCAEDWVFNPTEEVFQRE